jgi:hypothetical protein
MMVAGAWLVVAGFIGLGFSWYMNRAPAEDNLQPAAAPNPSVEEEEMSARHSSAELWKPEDDDRLRALSTFIESSSEIGRLLHRSPSAVRKRASLLGITVQGWRRRGNDDESFANSRCDRWIFDICLRSNRGAQGRQAGEAGKAVCTNGLQARGNSQRD